MAKRKRILELTLCLLFLLITSLQAKAEERTLMPPKDYKGVMYVTIEITGGDVSINEYANIECKIVWGPYETKPVSGSVFTDPLLKFAQPLALKFEKKKKDQVPLTVIVRPRLAGYRPKVSMELLTEAEFEAKKGLKRYQLFNPNWYKR